MNHNNNLNQLHQPLSLYNTATRTTEPFVIKNPDLPVKIYTCGPTVYDRAHLGNFAAYIYWDLLVRTLLINNYTVKRIINLTDVGHLSSDSDHGEDKLEKKARATNQTVWEIADRYIQLFLQDFKSLNLLPPTKFARATDYINQSISLIQTLTQKGYTYKLDDGIYFDTGKFTEYPNFAKLNLSANQTAERIINNPNKHHSADFALWKFILPGDNHAMRWDYLDRPGYPGWHLECSTIIHHELGQPIDIHTGGIDHIPIHHTNEIAQSEAAFNKPLSRYWLHCNFLSIDQQKISKSLGNTLNLDDLKAQGFSPLHYKLWVLQGHYRSERNFSLNDLASAKTRYRNWQNRILKIAQLDPKAYQKFQSTHTPNSVSSVSAKPNSVFSSHQSAIISAINQDLNSAKACQIIDNSDLMLHDWYFVDQIFGLNLFDLPTLSQQQLELLSLRAKARQNQDYALADRYRQELAALNLHVLDTKAGQIWQLPN